MKKIVIREDEGAISKMSVTATDIGVKIDIGADTPKGRVAVEFEFNEDSLLDLMDIMDVLNEGIRRMGG